MTAKSPALAALPACFLALLAGCSSGGTSSTVDATGAGASSLTSACSGSYTCSGGGQSATGDLQTQNGSCYLGSIELSPDGSGTDNQGAAYTWTGNASSFSLCQGSACFSCVRQGGSASSSGASAASCTGSADSCGHYGDEGACNDQQGCDWLSDYYQGVDYGSCMGTATSCDSLSTQSACTWQSGCSWK